MKSNMNWVPKFPFPNIIAGSDFYLSKHDTSDEHIYEMVQLEDRNWNDFESYLLRHFPDEVSAKEYIIQRNNMSNKGWVVDYGIHLFSGKTIGGLNFVNRGDKSLAGIYYLDKAYRGYGFISKALKIAEVEMSKIGFNKIVLEINIDNDESINVANKNGYKPEKTIYRMVDFIKDIRNLGR